jgi:hypothetical protein
VIAGEHRLEALGMHVMGIFRGRMLDGRMEERMCYGRVATINVEARVLTIVEYTASLASFSAPRSPARVCTTTSSTSTGFRTSC